jgi:RNA polymerase sigma-70 factor (ECF subfamily)
MEDNEQAGVLVARARAGDENAARDLIGQLYSLVARIVRGYRPQQTGEEDLCQMIFVKMFHHLDQYSGRMPLSHWVARIAVNTCRTQLAREKNRPELRLADLSEEQARLVSNLATSTDEVSPDDKLAARDLVEKMLAMLKPAERLVIDLLYLQQYSVGEVQQLTGWSASAVKVRAFRARQKLRKRLRGLQ